MCPCTKVTYTVPEPSRDADGICTKRHGVEHAPDEESSDVDTSDVHAKAANAGPCQRDVAGIERDVEVETVVTPQVDAEEHGSHRKFLGHNNPALARQLPIGLCSRGHQQRRMPASIGAPHARAHTATHQREIASRRRLINTLRTP